MFGAYRSVACVSREGKASDGHGHWQYVVVEGIPAVELSFNHLGKRGRNKFAVSTARTAPINLGVSFGPFVKDLMEAGLAHIQTNMTT